MGFDVKATRAWWDFFHRFSLVYTGSNFDYIVVLGLNLLQCGECQEDGINFYKTIGSHKTPFEKIHILHNYVNRKINKPIIDIEKCRQYSNDILFGNGKPNWLFLSRYYFSLLFAMTRYLEEKQLQDLKEFSAYIYQGFSISKKANSLAIYTKPKENKKENIKKENIKNKEKNKENIKNKEENKKEDRELLQLQIFDYYQRFNSSVGFSKHGKQYRDIYGGKPKKIRECKSCAKRHQLYLERHNQAKGLLEKDLPTPKTRQVIRQEIAKINREIIQEKTKLVNLVVPKIQSSQLKSQLTQINKSRVIKKPPSITKMLLDSNQLLVVPSKKLRDRKKFITDQRVVASMIIEEHNQKQQTQQVKYKSVVKKRGQVKMNPPQVNIRIKKASGKTVRKKVIPIEKPKRLITYKKSKIVRYKRKTI